jgi:glycine/D-amino acid oxidase-like deaminating enzyme
MFDWDEYFNRPEQVAKRKADMVAFYSARDAEDKRIKEELEAHRAILRAAAAELKADNDAAELKEYNRLFAADKARYLAAYNDDALAHSLACADAQYRENQKLGYSNE